SSDESKLYTFSEILSFSNRQFASPTPRYHTANIKSSPLSSCAIQRTVTAVLSFCAISGAAFASDEKLTTGGAPVAGGKATGTVVVVAAALGAVTRAPGCTTTSSTAGATFFCR